MSSAGGPVYDHRAAVFIEVAGIAAPREKELLIVGAGTGVEALALSPHFRHVEGIELRYEVVREEARDRVHPGDATRLEHPDGRFDLVYCYHVLEHVSEPEKALSEMHRVLRPGGTLYLGVPNKSRLIAYICVREAPLRERIMGNLIDYKQRLQGRFENRFGAHAGFTSSELASLLAPVFPAVTEVTDRYFLTKHRGKRLVRLIAALPWAKRVIWPSIYFVCRK